MRTLLVAVVLASGLPALAGPEHAKLRAELPRALKSGDLDARARAFEMLRRHRDVPALRIAIQGVEQVLTDRARIQRQIARDVTIFERARAKDIEAEDKLKAAKRRRLSSGRIRALREAEVRTSAHRKKMLRILKRTRAELRVSRQLLTSAARELGGLLARLGAIERRSALVLLSGAWLQPDDREAWLIWLDALVASDAPACSAELARLVRLQSGAPSRLRALALDGLVGIDPSGAQAAALRHLDEDLESLWHLVAASIRALRDLRRKPSIPALIAFLGKKDIHRLREDAHAALVALTHQTHGPYEEPWARWWAEAGPTFEVPPEEPKQVAREDGSSTAFYGIQTFSDRIVFAIDLSWSMWRTVDRVRRIDTALKELGGAVGTLDDSRRFAVVWFGTRAGTWKTRMVTGHEREKRALGRWIKDVDGKGQTNAYDGLERAFRFAREGAGRPAADTVFFLTDGSPTAGPLQERSDLLPELRAWCRIERVRLHCIGTGESDPALLASIAALASGRHVTK